MGLSSQRRLRRRDEFRRVLRDGDRARDALLASFTAFDTGNPEIDSRYGLRNPETGWRSGYAKPNQAKASSHCAHNGPPSRMGIRHIRLPGRRLRDLRATYGINESPPEASWVKPRRRLVRLSTPDATFWIVEVWQRDQEGGSCTDQLLPYLPYRRTYRALVSTNPHAPSTPLKRSKLHGVRRGCLDGYEAHCKMQSVQTRVAWTSSPLLTRAVESFTLRTSETTIR